MSLLELLGLSLAIVAVCMAALWLLSLALKNAGIVDIFWGLYVIAACAAAGYWTLFSPLLMTVLLLRVSGVALLERAQVETKPHYREYIESTSAFIPWFPRRRR